MRVGEEVVDGNNNAFDGDEEEAVVHNHSGESIVLYYQYLTLQAMPFFIPHPSYRAVDNLSTLQYTHDK